MNRIVLDHRVLLPILLLIIQIHHAKSVTKTSQAPTIIGLTTQDNDPSNSDPTTTIDPGSKNFTTAESEKQSTLESSETIVYNRFEKPPKNYDPYTTNEGDPEGPPDHVIPYSEHEEAKEFPRNQNPSGKWATVKNAVEFVPTKVYAQVRGTHTVKRLPQKEAIESAETEEEKENAPRLREVVTNSKVNTVYTEEGYEDSAYDHAGQVRDADFHEGFARKLKDHADVRKLAKDDGEGDEETGNVGYQKIDPEEFKDYDEDYRDHYDSTTNYGKVTNDGDLEEKDTWGLNPKLVAENGIQKLQQDLEKEAEEMEKGVEIQKLQKVEIESGEDREEDRSDLAETRGTYGHRDAKGRGTKKRKIESSASKKSENSENPEENLNEFRRLNPDDLGDGYVTTVVPVNSKVIPTNRDVEETTISMGKVTDLLDGSSSPKQSGYGERSSFQLPINSEADKERATTVSYSDIFWDFFKSKQNEATTQIPVAKEPTTLTPQFEEALKINANAPGPYFYLQETATLPSVFQSEVLPPQKLISSLSSVDQGHPGVIKQQDDISLDKNVYHTLPALSEGNYWKNTWQPFSNQDPVTLEPFSFPEAEDTIQVDEITENPEENPHPTRPQANSFVTFRKPRYKLLLRHKPTKPTESLDYTNDESSIPTPSTEKSSTESARQNDNYVKVLSYIRNEDPGPAGDYPRTNEFALKNRGNELEDLTRMRPPLPQTAHEVGYHSFFPDRPRRLIAVDQSSMRVESESPRDSNRNEFIVTQEQWANRLQGTPHQQDPINIEPFVYPRLLLPATGLLPPVPQFGNDYARFGSRETSRRNRNLSGAIRYTPIAFDAIRNVRARRRKRRSTSGGDGGRLVDDDDDEILGYVKATGSVANNGKSNRDKIERDRRNAMADDERRNSRRIGPDTSGLLGKQQAIQKKSRFNANGKGSLGPLHKGSEITDGESRVTSDGNEMKIGSLPGEMVRVTGDHVEPAETNGTLNESPNGQEPRDGNEKSVKRSVSRRNRAGKNHEELLNESPKVTDEVIETEINARFNNNGSVEDSSEREKGKVEIEIPDFDYVEELVEGDQINIISTTEMSVDHQKYPFYEKLPDASALRYAVDPRRIPKKTKGGMEFYDSRNAYMHCDEVRPEVETVLPENEEPVADRGLKENLPHLRGLGDKLDCFKAKYFDENPFDNPLFLEKGIEDPTPPSELDPAKFSSRITIFPKEEMRYVVQKQSKKPENYRRQQKTGSEANNRLHGAQSIRFDYKHPQTGRNTYFHSVRGTAATGREKGSTRTKTQTSSRRPVLPGAEFSTLFAATPYQSQVYEDVMGNIRHMANSYMVRETTTDSPSVRVLATASSNMKTNTVVDPSSSVIGEGDVTVIDFTERPGNSSNIEGLVPPKYPRYPPRYRRNKHRNRTGKQKTPGGGRIIGHYQKFQIRKRSIENPVAERLMSNIGNFRENSRYGRNNHSNRAGEQKILDGSKIIGHYQKFQIRKRSIENPVAEKLMSNIGNFRENSRYGRNKYSKQTDEQKVPDGSRNIGHYQKIQIHKRSIENPVAEKLKNDTGNFSENSSGNGEFSGLMGNQGNNETDLAIEESAPEAVLRSTLPGRDNEEINGGNRRVYTIKDRIRYSRGKEDTRKIGKFTNDTAVDEDHRRKEPRYNTIKRKRQQKTLSTVATLDTTTLTPTTDKEFQETREKENITSPETSKRNLTGNVEENAEETTTRTGNNYSVHENVTEMEPEISKLNSFANKDSSEFSEQSMSPMTHEKNNDSDVTPTDDEDHSPFDEKSSQVSYFSHEDSKENEGKSVEKPEGYSGDGCSSDCSSEENTDSRDRPFFEYNSRPFSPAESYEDEKYSDLGPRINKPAFHHPPFSTPRYRNLGRIRFKGYSRENDRNRDEDDYVFPWYRDKEDEENEKRESRFHKKIVDRYEYPWERRERLARERREEAEKYGMPIDDIDVDDDRSTAKYRRNIYPWDRYRFVDGHSKDVSRDVDSEESSSENRPVMKFSSRYSSKSIKSPPEEHNDKSLNTTSAEEISRSIQKVLEDDSGNGPRKNDNDSSRKKSLSMGNRGLSRGKIVPEDVTLAPRRKSDRKKNHGTIESTGVANSRKSLRNTGKLGQSEAIKSGKNNLENSESQVKVISMTPDKVINVTSHQVRKRKRRPSNDTVESSTKNAVEFVNKSRRRQRPNLIVLSTPTSVSSTSRNSRRKSQRRVEDVRKNNNNGKINVESHHEDETSSSTPKNKSLDHRSTTSEEEIILETRLPEGKPTENSRKRGGTRKVSRYFKHVEQSDKNDNSEQTEIPESKGIEESSEIDEEKVKENEKTITINEDEFVNKENDDFNESSTESFEFKKDEVKTINDFGEIDGVPDNDDDDKFGSIFKSENHLAATLLQSVPLLSTRDTEDGANQRETNLKEDQEKNEEEDNEEGKQIKLRNVKFIKDPGERMYYYVERRK